MSNKKSKTLRAYQKRAQVIRKFAPKARDWDLRRLTPAQKGWITRYENQLKGKGNILAISEKQARQLPREIQINGGIRGIAINVAEPGDKISVKNGNVIIKKTNRQYTFVPTGPDFQALASQAEISFAKPNVKQLFLYNSRGRSGEGARDLGAFVSQLAAWFQQYNNIQDWILGIVELAQNT